jgi:hypothetical protein
MAVCESVVVEAVIVKTGPHRDIARMGPPPERGRGAAHGSSEPPPSGEPRAPSAASSITAAPLGYDRTLVLPKARDMRLKSTLHTWLVLAASVAMTACASGDRPPEAATTREAAPAGSPVVEPAPPENPTAKVAGLDCPRFLPLLLQLAVPKSVITWVASAKCADAP